MRYLNTESKQIEPTFLINFFWGVVVGLGNAIIIYYLCTLFPKKVGSSVILPGNILKKKMREPTIQ